MNSDVKISPSLLNNISFNNISSLPTQLRLIHNNINITFCDYNLQISKSLHIKKNISNRIITIYQLSIIKVLI